MKLKRLLALLLSGVLLAGSLAITTSVGAQKKDEEEEELTAKDIALQYTQVVYSSPEEKLATMGAPVKSNDKFELYVLEETGEIALVTKETETAEKQILFSNPYGVAGIKNTAEETRSKLLSQIILTYTNGSNATVIDSYTQAAKERQIKIEKTRGGIRVNYVMGREQQRILVPEMIERSRFEEQILNKMPHYYTDENGNERKFVDEKIAKNPYEYVKAFFSLKSPSEAGSKRSKEQMIATWPITERYDIYILGSDSTVRDKKQLEHLISTYTEYTFDDIDEDHAKVEYESKGDKLPLFRVAIEYELTDEGLRVAVPASGIRYDSTSFTVSRIEVLPYFGAGSNDQKGFTLVNDGSGSIVRFEDNAATGNELTITSKVYGQDYSFHKIGGANQEVMRLPAFGVIVDSEYNTFDNEAYNAAIALGKEAYAKAKDLYDNGKNDDERKQSRVIIDSAIANGAIFAYDDIDAQVLIANINKKFPLPTIKVTFNVGEVENPDDYKEKTVVVGTDIPFPKDPVHPEGKFFVGWATTPIGEAIPDEPYKAPENDIAFHALYVDELPEPEEGEEETAEDVVEEEPEEEEIFVNYAQTRPFVNVDDELISMKSGYIAYIEEGDSLAEITTAHGGTVHGYNSAYAAFIPKPTDSYQLQGISATNSSTWTVSSKRNYTGSFTIMYIPVQKEKATTAGMAESLRNYLVDRGVLTKLEDDGNKNIPLYIESFGSIGTTKRVAGIPVDVQSTLTTFDDSIKMLGELKDAGVSNIVLKYTGWYNGGLYKTVPAKVKVDKEIGGEEGLKKLADYAKKNGMKVYPDLEFTYVNKVGFADGFDYKRDAVQTIDGRTAVHKVYSALYQMFEPDGQLILSPVAMAEYYEKMKEDYLALGVGGISVSTLGSDLSSDHNDDYPLTREDSKEAISELLATMQKDNKSVLVSGGNAYALQYADHIIDVPLNSSENVFASEAVPFTGMVLHGYKNFAGTAINLDGDYEKSVLKAIENGASPYFILSYNHENTSELKSFTDFSKFYSIRYNIWKGDLISTYKTINEALSSVKYETITSHEYIDTRVVKVTYSNGTEFILNYNINKYQTLEGDVIEPMSFIKK